MKCQKCGADNANTPVKTIVNGEFKEFYTKDTQALINNRFRDHKTLQESNGKDQQHRRKQQGKDIARDRKSGGTFKSGFVLQQAKKKGGDSAGQTDERQQ